MTKITTCIGLSLACISLNVAAVPAMPPYGTNVSFMVPAGWFMNIAGGAAWPYLPVVLLVNDGAPYPPGLGTDYYSTNSPTNNSLAVMGGYKWRTGCWWLPGVAVGARYQHFYTDSVDGAIIQYSLPQFVNYDYSFNLSGDLITAYSKVDLFIIERFIPYVDGGVGIGLTRADSYSEMAIPGVTPRISPAYANHSQTNIAWNVGAGMDFLITPKFTVSLGYDFQYLGTLETGKGVGTWADTHLRFGQYTANVIMLGISYFTDGEMRVVK